MDLATTIFWVGVGLGALLVGIGVIVIAVAIRPVARDARALANDARRLSRLAESELATMAGRTREMADGAEVMNSDLSRELDALKAQTDALEQRILANPVVTATTPVSVAADEMDVEPGAVGRQPVGSVQSPHAREDDPIA